MNEPGHISFLHSFTFSGPSWENTPSVFNPFTVSFAAFFLVNISRGIIDYRAEIFTSFTRFTFRSCSFTVPG